MKDPYFWKMTQRPRARSKKILAEPNVCPVYGQENPARAFLLRIGSSDPDHPRKSADFGFLAIFFCIFPMQNNG
ncbi:hypothetical protein [uncultured Thalassospira sp.]|jgi:hypothetical protein|uniref:hypothetical protein n=1 Tax=uncultured Thalassospira sp. TaxID=404382 RepID=UPI0030DB1019|tara:strand:- start:687 stop:908 length:222 start_codon:yes stop_codon:yes gene_type:complete